MIDHEPESRNDDLYLYVFTRLFDFSEKLKAGEIEQAALNAVYRYLDGEIELNTSPTFVPFRDTDQDQIISANKTQTIYFEDLKRLNKSTLILGFLDGQSKDEGVCFEIGYAYGKGIPSIGVITDFIRREYKELPRSVHLVDPVILCMLTHIVYNHQIASSEGTFEKRVRKSLDNALSELSEAVYRLLNEPIEFTPMTPKEELDIYIDIGGGRFEWERILLDDLQSRLISLGYSVGISTRNYKPTQLVDSPNNLVASINNIGMKDITSAVNAQVVITCSDMDEMSSGTAAIHGLARALNKKLLLVDTGTIDLVGDGDHRMSRNLMIDHSANAVAKKYQDIPELVDMLFKNDHYA